MTIKVGLASLPKVHHLYDTLKVRKKKAYPKSGKTF